MTIGETEKLIRNIELICEEQAIPRIWNLDEKTIEKYNKTNPAYKPKSGEEYEVGFVRGETWRAIKLQKELIKMIENF